MIKNEQERVRIGQRIAGLRKTIKWKDGAGKWRTGWTQAELAERSGLQRSHIARLEAGKYGATIDVLSAIAGALGVTVDFVEQ
jgi:transcriptional regulator with XRE-family HTH domain